MQSSMLSFLKVNGDQANGNATAATVTPPSSQSPTKKKPTDSKKNNSKSKSKSSSTTPKKNSKSSAENDKKQSTLTSTATLEDKSKSKSSSTVDSNQQENGKLNKLKRKNIDDDNGNDNMVDEEESNISKRKIVDDIFGSDDDEDDDVIPRNKDDSSEDHTVKKVKLDKSNTNTTEKKKESTNTVASASPKKIQEEKINTPKSTSPIKDMERPVISSESSTPPKQSTIQEKITTSSSITTTTTTITTTTTNNTKNSKDDKDDIEDEDKKEEDGEEEEVEEEYEEYEEEEEEEDEDGEKKIVNKTKFVRKQVTSKTKGSAKQLEQELHQLSKYHPIDNASWKKGQAVPYMALAKTFEAIEGTSRRLLIIEHLTNLFRSIITLSPNDLIPTIYLSINKIGPAYSGKELGIGEMILMKSVSESTGRTIEFIKQELKTAGDLGIVAQNSRMTQTVMFAPPPLTIGNVFKTLQAIGDLSGNASQNKKKDLIKKLLVSCKESEALYIIRSLQGKLRIGLAERSVLIALSRSLVITPPTKNILDIRKHQDSTKQKLLSNDEFTVIIDRAIFNITKSYSQMPNYDVLVPLLLKQDGFETILNTCSLKAGIPVKPMLAQPTNGISQVLDRFQDMEFTCEYKYDGERAQIHKSEDGKISIYTRNLEDYTGKYPDIIANIPKFIGENVKSFILDCEAVAYDPVNAKILPFQILSSRPRKGVTLEQIKVPVNVYAFDLLYLNGKSLVDEPLSERRKILYENFKQVAGIFTYAQFANITSGDVGEIQAYLEEAVTGNCEGLMVKTLNDKSAYEPSKRSYNWLKIKKDYLKGMTDSVDVVPIGAWHGKGKRTGVYGAYLLACYDDDNEDFQTLCKIGTGFSDEQLSTFTTALKPQLINNPKNIFRVHESLKPDVWFNPSQVWEVLAADLSISPIHTAGAGVLDPVKGVALRFPRFIRIRDDKNPEDATTTSQIIDMYRNQKINTFKMVDEDY